jgi:hypothetical protein
MLSRDVETYMTTGCVEILLNGVPQGQYLFRAGGTYTAFGAVVPVSGIWLQKSGSICFGTDNTNLECWSNFSYNKRKHSISGHNRRDIRLLVRRCSQGDK